MSLRPVIFISAVSRELKTSRQSVANTLTALGYTPDWQDIFPTDSGQLLAMLRKKVDGSRAVVQLVGQAYGAEPDTPVPGFGRVSYTQYEALHAKSRGKKVYYVFLAEGYTADPHDPEPDELRALQQAYASGIRATGDLRHPVATPTDLENKVLRLRDDLATLRRRTLQWAVGVSLALALLIGLVVVLRHDFDEEADLAEERHADATTSVLALAGDLDAIKRQLRDRGRDLEAVTQEELESLLAAKRGITVERLRAIVAGAMESDAALERAAAHLLAGDPDAALASLDQTAELQSRLIKVLEIRAQAYHAKFRYASALAERERIVALIDRTTDPTAWVTARFMVAFVLVDLGRNREAEPILSEVVAINRRMLGEEHVDTLVSRNNLANALEGLGLHAEAQEEHRAVLAIRERVLGAEHPDTLACRINLAIVLHDQGKYEQAEREYRDILPILERVAGAEHPDTLKCRNNLANALGKLGRFAEAEAGLRSVLALMERELGATHPSTLAGRNNLAIIHSDQGKHAEAEAEHRAVLEIQKGVMGPEHPHTLKSRHRLAIAFSRQRKYAEAEEEHRAVLAVQERVLGPEHPDTLQSRNSLANAIGAQGRFAAAVPKYRSLLLAQERVLGPEHPDTLGSRYNLAITLYKLKEREQGTLEAEAAVAGFRRALGDGHPRTAEAERLLKALKSE